jgi:hypothetical protein
VLPYSKIGQIQKEVGMMEELINRLNAIPNAYFEFIYSVVDYAESKTSHYTLIMDYLSASPSASISDVLKFISQQPDFFEDDVPDEAAKMAI